jgi:integrase
VKHPKNYRSGAKKLSAMVGDRLVSEFEPPHGRKIIVEVVNTLRREGHSDGYVRKIAYQLRQALSAAIGQGVSEPIGDPDTGDQLIHDIPTFPHLPKSKGRTAVLEKTDDEIVFKVMSERFLRAREEERAFAIKVDRRHELGIGARGRVIVAGQVVWLNPKRFSSGQWRTFRDYITFLIETGCRRSEALSVGNHSLREREVIDAEGAVVESYKVLHLPGEVSKNGDDRYINLTPKVLGLIKMWQVWAQPHSFQIGARTINRDLAWFPLQPGQITAMWQHVRDDAKRYEVDLSAISPHQLRHTHATRMSARGMSGKPLQEHLGHRDDRTTRIYDHAQQVENSRPFYRRNVGA